MESDVYLDRRNIFVSDDKIEFGGTVYAPGEISSVRLKSDEEVRGTVQSMAGWFCTTFFGGGFAVMALGAFADPESSSPPLLMFLFLGAFFGVVMLFTSPDNVTKFEVKVRTSSGGGTVLDTKNKQWAQKVKSAIEEAIL